MKEARYIAPYGQLGDPPITKRLSYDRHVSVRNENFSAAARRDFERMAKSNDVDLGKRVGTILASVPNATSCVRRVEIDEIFCAALGESGLEITYTYFRSAQGPSKRGYLFERRQSTNAHPPRNVKRSRAVGAIDPIEAETVQIQEPRSTVVRAHAARLDCAQIVVEALRRRHGMKQLADLVRVRSNSFVKVNQLGVDVTEQPELGRELEIKARRAAERLNVPREPRRRSLPQDRQELSLTSGPP